MRQFLRKRLSPDKILNKHSVDRPGKEHLYCVVPNSDRTSFACQQMRVFNVCWALSKRYGTAKQIRVAIVGAGVSGVTAALTLCGYGYAVTVFDPNKNVLRTQRNVQHRMVHPSVQYWPSTNNINPTTNFPFLNWGAGSCKAAIKWLEQQWSEVLNSPRVDLTFEHSTTIDHIENGPGGRKTLYDTLETPHKHFDFVVLASGFDKEYEHEDISGFGYWENDNLEDWKDSPKKDIHVIVSGCSEGGVFDVLRAAYKFEFGELAYSIANLARGSVIERELKTSPFEASTYDRLVDKIALDDDLNDIRELLETSLEDDRVGFVSFVDAQFGCPFKTKAPPIHKLLLCYAMQSKIVNFYTGIVEMDEDRTNFVIKLCDSRSQNPTYPVGDSTRCFFRFGAPKQYGNIFADHEIIVLEDMINDIPEITRYPQWRQRTHRAIKVPHALLCRHQEPQKFAEYLSRWAELSLQNAGLKDARISAKEGMFIISGVEDAHMYKELFGVKVKPHSAPKNLVVP